MLLHELNTFFGISKGLKFQPNFFLTNETSLTPSGLPCDDAFPDLFGDP